MTTFLLIRHASHDLLGPTRVGRMPDVHLNELGRREARSLGERLAALSIDAVYASPIERGRETAQAIAERVRRSILTDDAFAEIPFGDWTGTDFDRRAGEPAWRTVDERRHAPAMPGGETIQQVQARVVGGLRTLRERYPAGRVVVVSHGDVLKTGVAWALGMDLDSLHRFELSPASISLLEMEGDRVRVTRLNDTCGLPGRLAAPHLGGLMSGVHVRHALEASEALALPMPDAACAPTPWRGS